MTARKIKATSGGYPWWSHGVYQCRNGVEYWPYSHRASIFFVYMMARRIIICYYTLFPQGLIEQASSNNNLKTITQFFIFGIIDKVLKM
jgi:hypothetical protein